MIELFNTLFYQPIFNLLVFLYNIVPGNDFGLAIIGLTVLIKIILYPFSLQSIKLQKSLQSLQPKVEELKKRYSDQKEELAKALLRLYQKEKVNPLSSCFPLLIQFPFLIAIFQIFRSGLKDENLNLLYSFVRNPGVLNPIAFGLFDLAQPVPVLAVLAGVAQWIQTKMMITKEPPKEIKGKEGTKDETMAAIISRQMTYLMPAMTIFVGFTLPGGLTLYWLVTTLLMILQQKVYLGKTQNTLREIK